MSPLRLLLLLLLQRETAAFSAAAPPCTPALALGMLATVRPSRRCSAPALQEARHRHKMQESRGGSGGAPRAQQPQRAATQKLRGAATRHQQEAKKREGQRALRQKTTRGPKRSKAVLAASSSAERLGFGGVPASWRRREQPGDESARVDVSKVESLLLMRGAVLQARNYEAADELLGQLAQLGVAVRDEEMVWWLKH